MLMLGVGYSAGVSYSAPGRTLSVVETSPVRAVLDAPTDGSVSVTFDRAIDPDSIVLGLVRAAAISPPRERPGFSNHGNFEGEWIDDIGGDPAYCHYQVRSHSSG